MGGYLSDRFGRKIVFYTGVVGIVAATWFVVFPKYFAVFLAGRVLNGLGSGTLSFHRSRFLFPRVRIGGEIESHEQ